MFEQMAEERVEVESERKPMTTDQELLVRVGLLQKEIQILHDRIKKAEQENMALRVGFSELRQHLGPLLDTLKKPEF